MTQIDLLTFAMRTEAPQDGADWFRIVEAKKGEATKVYIYDEIGFWGTTAKDFAAQLADIDNEMEIHFNSPGGSVFDGLAIHASIKAHKKKVTGIVDGLAASAASFILQACDVRQSTRNAQVMIHDAKAYAGGTAEQMRKAADLLDKVSDNIADMYAVRSGQGSVTSWRDIMRAGDEWYDGNEALDAGLVDEVLDNPAEDDAPDEATKNSWTTTEVEAFLATSPIKLAASAKHVTITNRVEEAPMSGTDTPQNTPPAAVQPPAVNSIAANAISTGTIGAGTINLAPHKFMVNGVEVVDFSAVQAHIDGLQTFKNETITAGRTEFVKSLVADNKIMADEKTLEATEMFAQSLSSEQFTAWKETMSSAPANNLFGKHGVSQGDNQAPVNGGSPDDVARKIATLTDIVQSHRDGGMTEEVLKTKASYVELQSLKSTVK